MRNMTLGNLILLLGNCPNDFPIKFIDIVRYKEIGSINILYNYSGSYEHLYLLKTDKKFYVNEFVRYIRECVIEYTALWNAEYEVSSSTGIIGITMENQEVILLTQHTGD